MQYPSHSWGFGVGVGLFQKARQADLIRSRRDIVSPLKNKEGPVRGAP